MITGIRRVDDDPFTPLTMRGAGGLAPMVVLLMLSAAFAGCLKPSV